MCMHIRLEVTAGGRLLSWAGVLPPTGYMLYVELAIKSMLKRTEGHCSTTLRKANSTVSTVPRNSIALIFRLLLSPL
jgi:hypothetical protein